MRSAARPLRRSYTPRRTGLGYIPAIDGLRALAVAAVLLYHSGVSWLPGGFLGVEIFFVISGYLITSLLLSEQSSTGRLNVGAFWFRRARRLLPAVVALIVGVIVYVAIFLPEELAGLRGDAIAALLYVSNWYLIFEDQSYFESFGRPSLLQHLWSLAVEEQFYILWPIVFGAVLVHFRRGFAAVLVLGAAAASTILMMALYEPGTDPSRVYYGTDTRIAGLLIGAALAFVWAPGRIPRGWDGERGIPDAFGFAAIAGLAAICVLVGQYDSFLYRRGFAVTALLTAGLIAAVVHPAAGPLKTALGWPLLVWIGVRSYSIYLWHWPVFMLTRPGIDVDADGPALFAARIAITLLLAEASFRLIETPIRRGGLGRLWGGLKRRTARAPLLAPAAAVMVSATAVVSLAFVVGTAEPPAPPPSLAAESVDIRSWSVGSQRDIDGGLAIAIPTPSPTPSPVPATPPPTAAPTEAPAPAPPPAEPAAAPATPPSMGLLAPRVLAVGESVMLGAHSGLVAAIPNIEIDAAISRTINDDIGILRYRRDTGTLGDVVIIHVGNNGLINAGHAAEIMEILSAVPRVVWVNLKLPARAWEGPNNAVIAAAVQQYPNATLVDWHSAGNAHPEYFLEDGIHLDPKGYPFYAGLIGPHTH